MDERPTSSHVRTIYSHRKHGSQIPQVIPAQRILVQPKKSASALLHGYTAVQAHSSTAHEEIESVQVPPVRPPRKQRPDKMQPRIPPGISEPGSNVYAKDTPDSISSKSRFIPRIPELSPNSFSQAWRKEEAERNGFKEIAPAPTRHRWTDDEYFEPLQEEPDISYSEPNLPPLKPARKRSELSDECQIAPSECLPHRQHRHASPSPSPRPKVEQEPLKTNSENDSTSCSPASSTSTSSESLGDLRIKDYEKILKLFAVKDLDELVLDDFEPDPDAGKTFYSISARKGVVQFELIQTAIQNYPTTFAMTPVAIGFTVKCRISRDKKGLDRSMFPNYYMHLEFPDGRRSLVLTARKRKKSTTSNYLISVDPSDMTRYGDSYVGKVRSNLLGTQFTIYDSRNSPKNFSYQYLAHGSSNYREELGTVTYETNVLGFKGPRKMSLVIPAMMNESQRYEIRPEAVQETISEQVKRDRMSAVVGLRNKQPLWHDENQSYVLNFSGRVTLASVKNFQIVHPNNEKYIILQFGRIDDDVFTLDFCYPFCPLQAFAIALSSFDHKLACE